MQILWTYKENSLRSLVVMTRQYLANNERQKPNRLFFGNSFYQLEKNGVTSNTRKNFSLIYELNVSGHYKIIPWLGVGLGSGYRFMYSGNSNTSRNFNSPIYVLKIKVFLGDIYKSVDEAVDLPVDL